MGGIGAESAYGNAASYQGLHDWMRQRRQQTVEGQQDTLFQQGQEDRTTAAANEQAIARQKLLDQHAAQQDQAEMLGQIDALDLPPLAKLGAKISIKQGKPLPNELLAMLKPKEPKLQFAPNGQLVDLSNPELAGQNFAAPKEPTKPHMAFAPNGQVVNLDDPSISGQNFAAPKAGPSEAAGLAAEMARIRIEDAKQKQADAATDRAKDAAQAQDTTRSALDSVTRLLDPKGVGGGLDSTYGNWELRRGRTQASTDFQAERDRFVAMLALPNLGKLKGSMSDNDMLFIKQISSKLSNDNISEDEARKEMARAKVFLESKLGGAPGGGGGGAPMTRTQKNKRTGETRTQTSTDGGETWQ